MTRHHVQNPYEPPSVEAFLLLGEMHPPTVSCSTALESPGTTESSFGILKVLVNDETVGPFASKSG